MFNIDTNESDKREFVADHEFIDAQGNEVEETETATGYRYTLLAIKNEPFVWQWDAANENERRMLALFGAKTLATNETLQVRNAKKNKGLDTLREQLTALQERFKMVGEGQWVDRTREGGFRVDRPKLATAAVNVKIEAGKLKEFDRDAEYARVLQKIEEDAEYLKRLRQIPEVIAAYAVVMGRPTASINDI